MSEKLSQEEVALLIRARKLLKSKGLPKDIDVKAICENAGVSRKTGYQWAQKENDEAKSESELAAQLSKLTEEHERLKRLHDDVDFENEGRKLAWEIHGVDELLAEKKSTMARKKKKNR